METGIKRYAEQAAKETRRPEPKRVHRRDQVFGLLLVALAIVLRTLFHTNPKWIFSPGWWRP